MSRDYTASEVKALFLNRLRVMVEEWAGSSRDDVGKLNGLAFSILALLDGEEDGLPPFVVAPLSWLSREGYVEVDGDIAGDLHYEWEKFRTDG